MKIENVDESTKLTTFIDGSFRKVVELDSVFVGKGVYKPGWRWSKHVGPMTGKAAQSHIGCVVSGRFKLQGPDGNQYEAGPSDAFELGPNHDAWVIGDEPCEAIDFEVKE